MTTTSIPVVRRPWRPVISVDFDGVLHLYDGIWSPGRIEGPAVPGAMRWLQQVYLADKCDIAISSARSRYLRGRWAMKRWLREKLIFELGHQAGPSMDPLYLEILESIKWPWTKPSALLYIDDRAYCFAGRWPEVSEMLKFKPWNRRPPFYPADNIPRDNVGGRCRHNQPANSCDTCWATKS